MVIRMRFLPRPEPPPLWFERYVIWSYFGYSVTCLYFAPGAILAWVLGAGDAVFWGWMAASVALGAYSVGLPWRRVRVTRTDIPIVGLDPAFDGVLLALLSDLHVGPYTPEARARRWIQRANALRPDYILLTGDLIASGERFIEPLERSLAELRPTRGVFAIMGNHDYFGPGVGDAIVNMHRRLGHQMLRNEHVVLRTGSGRLVVAGVDDTWRQLSDLGEALAGAPSDVPVVLLAHDPDLFAEAISHGVDLQVSGHTHGGQLAIPFAGRRGSVLALFRLPWIQGLYQRGRSRLYVSAGLGTTGAPVRIGMASELPLLRIICAG